MYQSLLSFLLFLGIGSSCFARVDIKTTKPLQIPVDNATPRLSSSDVAKVVPLDIPNGSSQETIVTRIVDRNISNFFNSSFIKQSSLGQIAQKTQEKLNTQLELGSSEPESVQHKISFKVEALQTLAKLEYSGWLNAAINYDIKEAVTDISLNEKVFDNKDLFVTYKATGEKDISMVGLAWSW